MQTDKYKTKCLLFIVFIFHFLIHPQVSCVIVNYFQWQQVHCPTWLLLLLGLVCTRGVTLAYPKLFSGVHTNPPRQDIKRKKSTLRSITKFQTCASVSTSWIQGIGQLRGNTSGTGIWAVSVNSVCVNRPRETINYQKTTRLANCCKTLQKQYRFRILLKLNFVWTCFFVVVFFFTWTMQKKKEKSTKLESMFYVSCKCHLPLAGNIMEALPPALLLLSSSVLFLWSARQIAHYVEAVKTLWWHVPEASCALSVYSISRVVLS